MKKLERDILADRPELKKLPYSTPEGYFDSFKREMNPAAGRQERRVFPYIAAAAAAALLLTTGILLSRPAPYQDELTYEDFISLTDMDLEYYELSYTEDELTAEDIINYLIYSDISAEEIEQYK